MSANVVKEKSEEMSSNYESEDNADYPQYPPLFQRHKPWFPYPHPQQDKKKFTSTELILLALDDMHEMTVSQIYTYIAEHFPFYIETQAKWKRTIRNRLSMSSEFQKGTKDAVTRGHRWSLVNNNKVRINDIKRRLHNFLKDYNKKKRSGSDSDSSDDSDDILPSSILQQYMVVGEESDIQLHD